MPSAADGSAAILHINSAPLTNSSTNMHGSRPWRKAELFVSLKRAELRAATDPSPACLSQSSGLTEVVKLCSTLLYSYRACALYLAVCRAYVCANLQQPCSQEREHCHVLTYLSADRFGKARLTSENQQTHLKSPKSPSLLRTQLTLCYRNSAMLPESEYQRTPKI